MNKKKKKVESKPDYIIRWEKRYRRYQRIYNLIMLLGLAAVAAVWYFTNHFWGIAAFAFGMWSMRWYEDGAQEDCMEEWEYAYPKDGFRRMFYSWPWAAVLIIIAYFFCHAHMPWLF